MAGVRPARYAPPMANKDDDPKRLEPSKDVLRQLFLKSGNLCAFSGCNNIMMNAQGDFIGQICHIEGVKGERFRATMSNEERRAFKNLMLLCYQHHIETNDEKTYTVAKLVKMKADHEARFTDPSAVMLEAFIDQTRSAPTPKVANLARMNAVLGWNHAPVEMDEAVEELNAFLAKFVTVPIEVRRFFGAVVERAWFMRDSGVVQQAYGDVALKVDDFRTSHKISLQKIKTNLALLESYKLACHEELSASYGSENGIRIYSLKSGWPFWNNLAEFCDIEKEPLSVFIDQLEFSRLDA
jgi:hypothetical protein